MMLLYKVVVKKIALDNKYYIFEDKMVNATKHILSLYNELQNQEENKLYAKLTNGKTEPKKAGDFQ